MVYGIIWLAKKKTLKLAANIIKLLLYIRVPNRVDVYMFMLYTSIL